MEAGRGGLEAGRGRVLGKVAASVGILNMVVIVVLTSDVQNESLIVIVTGDMQKENLIAIVAGRVGVAVVIVIVTVAVDVVMTGERDYSLHEIAMRLAARGRDRDRVYNL